MSETSLRLILFIAASEPNSLLARENLDLLCREELDGKCDIEIVDILSDARPALEHGVIVTPSLLIYHGETRIIIAGNLNNREKVRIALHLPPLAVM